jgi:ATP-dependent DNA helicase DinG
MEFEGLRGPDAPGTPWEDGAARLGEVAFAALEASGADPSVDRLVRLRALRRSADGEDVAREFDIGGDARAVWTSFAQFVHGASVVVASAEGFSAWAQRFRATDEEFLRTVGLDEIEALLFPLRSRRRAVLGLAPDDVRAALSELVERFAGLSHEVHVLVAAGWTSSWRRLTESAPNTASALACIAALIERPSLWRDDGGARDGLLALAQESRPESSDDAVWGLADVLRPRWADVGAAWKPLPTVPVSSESAEPLPAADLEALDELFEVRLPALFARPDGEPSYRKGQHEVARQVARWFGARKLLLVHAPTGTGKTLSYLAPAMLWALRNNVRVAISTYTKALQDQALDAEAPRALTALKSIGVTEEPRITLLKGRENYVCWRALRLHAPAENDSGEAWLAWTSLTLFALLDESGDLDRFPMRCPLALGAQGAASYVRELDSLVRATHAALGCCSARGDRETCAAEVSRLRAERSHILITNHAFALVRQALFKHAIFDECEHLHDQCGGAWSFKVTLREIHEQLSHLRQPGRSASRAVLDRLERIAIHSSELAAHSQAANAAWLRAWSALEALQVAVDAFKSWREEQRRKREARDEHSLLREYLGALEPDAERKLDARASSGAKALLDARGELLAAATELDSELSQIAGLLDGVQAPGVAKLRRSLELARGDLFEWRQPLENFAPVVDGKPAFAKERFYDIELDSRGQDLLAARVLLPNELLGRTYYPALDGAVLISATTWLRGGFETSMGYLGLDRAREPLEGETRAPSEVVTFRAEDPFDYSRVLVGIPNDPPDVAGARSDFQGYVRRFLAHLAERTRGRVLALFTNADEARRTGEELVSFFRARGIPLWFQGMAGVRKEELGDLFRARPNSVLLGVDTFWYGADFPGETLEYLVIVKLPYGVPDRYHHAQCAALGQSEQRRRIYLPRALSKFRQGFGRLMRRESDRGCVFVLDRRILVGANKLFLGELPVDSELGRSAEEAWPRGGAKLVLDSTDKVVDAAFEHMQLEGELRRRGLATPFAERPPPPEPRIVPDDLVF